MISNKTIAILTAGGIGARFIPETGEVWNKSKVWVVQDGKTMLEHTLEQLLPITKIDNIYVLFDVHSEQEFYRNKELCQRISERYNLTIGKCSFNNVNIGNNRKVITYLREKDKYPSTFMILKEFLKNIQTKADRLLFVYGHSPRPKSYYEEMLYTHIQLATSPYGSIRDALVATQVPKSTRRLPISMKILYPNIEDESVSLTRKIEPPYVLNTSLVEKSKSADWLNFFDSTRALELLLETPLLRAPHEFNYKNESDSYMEYIQSQYKTCDTDEELMAKYPKLYA